MVALGTGFRVTLLGSLMVCDLEQVTHLTFIVFSELYNRHNDNCISHTVVARIQ